MRLDGQTWIVMIDSSKGLVLSGGLDILTFEGFTLSDKRKVIHTPLSTNGREQENPN